MFLKKKKINLEDDDFGTYFKLQNKHTKKPVKLKYATRTITDEEGLSRAYQSDKDVYVFGDTLYI